MRAPKFRKGEQISSITELVDHILNGGWVYMVDRPKHPGWMMSMRLHTLANFVRTGSLFWAIPNNEDETWRERERLEP